MGKDMEKTEMLLIGDEWYRNYLGGYGPGIIIINHKPAQG